MRALSQEKYDQAETAFKMYENVLRKTDNLMDELKPEEAPTKENFAKVNKIIPGIFKASLWPTRFRISEFRDRRGKAYQEL